MAQMDWGRAGPGSFTGIPDFAGNALQVLLSTSCPAVTNTGQGKNTGHGSARGEHEVRFSSLSEHSGEK